MINPSAGYRMIKSSRGGRESFWKWNDGFCFMYLYFKGNTKLCSEVQEILLFSIVTGSYNLEVTIHGKTQQNVLIS